MSSTITIDGVTTEVYSSSELRALVVAATGGQFGTIDGFKYRYRLKTFRLFSKSDSGSAKVMFAPTGFTWEPSLKVASATTGTTRTLYFDKAQVDAVVGGL